MKKSLYLRIFVGLVLIMYTAYIGLCEIGSAFALASFAMPFRVSFPEGEGGGGGGGGAPETVTIPKTEYDQLKAQPEQMFGNGVKEGQNRFREAVSTFFKNKGYTLSGDDVTKGIEGVIAQLEQKAQAPNDQVLQLTAQNESYKQNIEKLTGEKTAAEQDRDNYIVNSELMNAVAARAHNPQAAVQLFLSQSGYSIRLTTEGVRVYKGGSHYFVKGQLATPKDVMDEFLDANQWLVKTDSGALKTGGNERTGIDLGNTDLSNVSPEEATKMLADLRSGKLKL